VSIKTLVESTQQQDTIKVGGRSHLIKIAEAADKCVGLTTNLADMKRGRGKGCQSCTITKTTKSLSQWTGHAAQLEKVKTAFGLNPVVPKPTTTSKTPSAGIVPAIGTAQKSKAPQTGPLNNPSTLQNPPPKKKQRQSASNLVPDAIIELSD